MPRSAACATVTPAASASARKRVARFIVSKAAIGRETILGRGPPRGQREKSARAAADRGAARRAVARRPILCARAMTTAASELAVLFADVCGSTRLYEKL